MMMMISTKNETNSQNALVMLEAIGVVSLESFRLCHLLEFSFDSHNFSEC